MNPLETPASPANKALVLPVTAVVAWVIRGVTTGDWTDDGAASLAIASLVAALVVYVTPNRPRLRT
jgi:hypothetical protein